MGHAREHDLHHGGTVGNREGTSRGLSEVLGTKSLSRVAASTFSTTSAPRTWGRPATFWM